MLTHASSPPRNPVHAVHELGHILTNAGHWTGTQPGDRNHDSQRSKCRWGYQHCGHRHGVKASHGLPNIGRTGFGAPPAVAHLPPAASATGRRRRSLGRRRIRVALVAPADSAMAWVQPAAHVGRWGPRAEPALPPHVPVPWMRTKQQRALSPPHCMMDNSVGLDQVISENRATQGPGAWDKQRSLVCSRTKLSGSRRLRRCEAPMSIRVLVHNVPPSTRPRGFDNWVMGSAVTSVVRYASPPAGLSETGLGVNEPRVQGAYSMAPSEDRSFVRGGRCGPAGDSGDDILRPRYGRWRDRPLLGRSRGARHPRRSGQDLRAVCERDPKPGIGSPR